MLHLLYALLATARSSLKAQRELALGKDTPDLRQREANAHAALDSRLSNRR